MYHKCICSGKSSISHKLRVEVSVMSYIVKSVHKKTGSVTYHLQGHSKLTGGAKKVSKYYVYDKERGAKSLMKRLQAQPDGMDYDWSVVTTEAEGIEVQ